MKVLNPESRNTALKAAAVITTLYTAIIVTAALCSENYYVFIGLVVSPVLFGLVYCFTYTLKERIIVFVTPSDVKDIYRNPVDEYFKSEWDKDVGGIILTIICFIPMFIFYFTFSWAYYIAKA